jgi:diketogulonate reductase-like aldo/keto reductase
MSTNPQRIAENIDVFDFELSTEELAASTPSTRACVVAPSLVDHRGELRTIHP